MRAFFSCRRTRSGSVRAVSCLAFSSLQWGPDSLSATFPGLCLSCPACSVFAVSFYFSWCLFILSCVFGLCSLFLSLSLSLQRARSLFPPYLPVSHKPPLSRSVSQCSRSVALSPLHTCKHLAHRRSTVEAAIFGQYVWEKLKMEVKAVVVAASMHACIYACMRVCVRLCQYV